MCLQYLEKKIQKSCWDWSLQYKEIVKPGKITIGCV